MLQDVRYALRTLAKNPGFSAAAVVTLALGIGANTAILSLADAVLLRAPPVYAPDRLATIFTTCRLGALRCSSSYPDYEDYRSRATGFADMAAYSWVPLNMGDGLGAQLATGVLATGNYFQLLGVSPAAGRLLRQDDNRRADPRAVAVLSHSLWRSHFASSPDAVGQTIRLNGTPFTIVGVSPAGFRGLDLGGEPDLWIPMLAGQWLGEGAGAAATPGVFEDRGARWIHAIVGRLAENTGLAQARAQMLAISSRMAEEDPDARGPRSVTVDGMPSYLLPIGQRGELVRFVAFLTAAVGFTLLLACANIANLLLSRAVARRGEIGIRIAVGAGRGRLVRQLLTESVLLAMIGGAAGLLVAIWMIDLLSGFELPGAVGVAALAIGLDTRMLLLAGGLSLVTGVLFGVLPAWQAARSDVVSELKGDLSAGAGRRQPLRKSLLALQVALCLVLLVGSGIFIRTLRTALDIDLGFEARGVATARFNLALLRYTPEQAHTFVASLLERVRGLPWVEAASVSTLAPLDVGGFFGGLVTVAGYQVAPDEEIRVTYVFVSPGYFQALGIPLLRGRGIAQDDDEASSRTMVVSQTMAQRYWSGRNPIGGRVRFGGTDFEVVGVAADTRWRELTETPTPFVFLPLAQSPGTSAEAFLTLAVRGSGEESLMMTAIRDELRSLDPELSLSELETMGRRVRRALMPQRMGSTLLTVFATLGLVLAIVGVYGVVAYTARQQTRATGIRIALGATRWDVMRSVIRDGAVPVAVGMVVGVSGAVVLTRLVEGLLVGASPHDITTLLLTVTLLGTVALAATLVPAWRAAAIEPMEVLRYE